MDVFPTPEQAELADTAARFVARDAPRDRVRALETSDEGFDRAHWARMADLGWTELAPVELALVVEQLGRAALPSPLVVTGALRNALPEIAAAANTTTVVTLATLVPGAVDERAGPHPRADASTNRLRATYLLVPYASAAHRFVVATAHGLATVERHVDAVVLRRHDAVGGDPVFRVEVRDAPLAAIDGSLDTVLTHLGVMMLAYTVGAADTALALAVEHARNRHQFGRPIGSFQAVAHRCADMRAEVDACRVLAYRAAWALSDPRGPGAELAVASALGYAKDALRRVAMHAHQVHGAIGFSTEHDLHLFTRGIKAFELTAGTTAWHHQRLATAIGLRP